MITRNIKWAWILGVAQVLLAAMLFYYEPYEYGSYVSQARLNAHADHIQLSMDFYNRHWPPPAGIALRAMNYPALVLSRVFDFLLPDPLYSNRIREIYLSDVAFIGLVFVLWYLVGTTLDKGEWYGREQRQPASSFLMVAYVAGMTLGAVGASLATRQLFTGNGGLPERQLFTFGLLWSTLLFGYSLWKSYLCFKQRKHAAV